MKRFFCCFLMMMIFTGCLTSCISDSLLEIDSPHLLLTACVYYSVPGFYQSDMKGVRVETIETDDYGRTLVLCEKFNWLTEQYESAYVICQKYGDATICFYEDINYTWVDEFGKNLENLKRQNDWNKEINEAKFSSRNKIKVTIDLCLVKALPFSDFSDEKFYISLSEYCRINKEEITSVQYCDWNGQNQVLYMIKLKNDEKFFCIVDKEYNTFAVKIENPYDLSNDICELKRQSNWYYGY